MEGIPALMIPVSPLFEQNAIVDHIENMTSSLNLAEQQAELEIYLIHEFQTHLIHNVATGKVNVRSMDILNEKPVDIGDFSDLKELNDDDSVGDEDMENDK